MIGAGAASGGVMDASNLIKPVLANGELRCIGSTTYTEYRGIFEKDHALARRFQKIDVVEPSVQETVEILRGLKSRFEEHHGITYSDEALRAAVELSSKHINDRHLPDKAIDVIDEAGANCRLQPEATRPRVVDVEIIQNIVAKMARIPPKNVSASDRDVLRHLERDLKLVIFGQDRAIGALAAAIKMARSGLGDERRPVGSFLFSGPTGVGKTEVTRQLALTMGVELIRFDMSEYMERHTVSRLIGAPPGYVGFDQGGLLTEAITKHPHCVLLVRRDREGAPGSVQLAAAGHGPRHAHGQQRPQGRLPERDDRDDHERGRAGSESRVRRLHDAGSLDRRDGGLEEAVLSGIPQSARRDHPVRAARRAIGRESRRQADRRARGSARQERRDDRARSRGARVDREARLRQEDGSAADGPRDPGAHQAAARRGAFVRAVDARADTSASSSRRTRKGLTLISEPATRELEHLPEVADNGAKHAARRASPRKTRMRRAVSRTAGRIDKARELLEDSHGETAEQKDEGSEK